MAMVGKNNPKFPADKAGKNTSGLGKNFLGLLGT
jgi:hypothetical protein